MEVLHIIAYEVYILVMLILQIQNLNTNLQALTICSKIMTIWYSNLTNVAIATSSIKICIISLQY